MHVSDGGRRLSAGVDAGAGLATSVVRALDAASVLVDNIEVRQPSLDDVFFSLTGGHIEEEESAVEESAVEAPAVEAPGVEAPGVEAAAGGSGSGGSGSGGSRDQTELEGANAQ